MAYRWNPFIGNLDDVGSGGGGGGTPGGDDTDVQFNDNGSFGGDAGLTYDKTTQTVTTANQVFPVPGGSTIELHAVVNANWDGESTLIIVDPVGSSGAAHETAFTVGSTYVSPTDWSGVTITALPHGGAIKGEITPNPADGSFKGDLSLYTGNTNTEVTLIDFRDGDASIKFKAGASGPVLSLFETGRQFIANADETVFHGSVQADDYKSSDGTSGTTGGPFGSVTVKNGLVVAGDDLSILGGLISHGPPQLRLTTQSGVPVSTGDRSAQTTLYASPSSPNGSAFASGFLRTYTGSQIRLQETGEVSLSLSLTSGKNYDVFIKNSDLSLVLSSAWTNDTTRADTLTAVKDLIVANADNTYLWLGTIRASATNQVTDSATKRFVWNAHNRVRRNLLKLESTDNWTYSTAAFRQANGSAANQVEVVCGERTETLDLAATHIAINNNVDIGLTGIGINLTNENTVAKNLLGSSVLQGAVTGVAEHLSCRLSHIPALGYTLYAWVEAVAAGVGTTTWYSSDGASRASGLTGTFIC